MNEIQIGVCKAVAMARIGNLVPLIHDPLASPFKAAILRQLLPDLHLLTLVGMLDEVLIDYIDTQQISWPAKTRHDLFNRIRVVSDHTGTLDADELQKIRVIRNSIAHSADSAFSGKLDWDGLEKCVEVLAATFVALGIFPVFPSIAARFDRIPEFFDDDVGPSGETFVHHHSIAATVDGVLLLRFGYDVSYFPPEAPSGNDV